MRKMEYIFEMKSEKLVEEINKIYQKAERIGYKIISTQIVKEPMGGFFAYIDYETRSDKK